MLKIKSVQEKTTFRKSVTAIGILKFFLATCFLIICWLYVKNNTSIDHTVFTTISALIFLLFNSLLLRSFFFPIK